MKLSYQNEPNFKRNRNYFIRLKRSKKQNTFLREKVVQIYVLLEDYQNCSKKNGSAANQSYYDCSFDIKFSLRLERLAAEF